MLTVRPVSVILSHALLAERERRAAEIAALKAENERLREALTNTSNNVCAPAAGDMNPQETELLVIRAAARAALEGK